MELIDQFPVRLATHSRLPEVNQEELGFGEYTSDHMLVCHYAKGRWHNAQICPYGEINLSPSTLALHYGQSIFEGMKAFRHESGKINIFRIQKHYERFLQSADRMCMPAVEPELFRDGMKQLMEVDRDWVPAAPGTSLYIRPFMFASEAKFGVKVSDEYYFIIFTGPVAPYFPKPIKVKVETEYIRASRGGTGYAKCAGNYGGVFYPTQKARQEGYDQVLWTDGKQNRFIEESGTMNVMFVINGTIITPALSDSILDGVTRHSLLTLATKNGIPVEERDISVEELETALMNGSLTEAFGTGTAAVTSPIVCIGIRGRDHKIPADAQAIMTLLTKQFEDIRRGHVQDEFGWNELV
jgi:branched-chain amino acid aminotransferase